MFLVIAPLLGYNEAKNGTFWTPGSKIRVFLELVFFSSPRHSQLTFLLGRLTLSVLPLQGGVVNHPYFQMFLKIFFFGSQTSGMMPKYPSNLSKLFLTTGDENLPEGWPYQPPPPFRDEDIYLDI